MAVRKLKPTTPGQRFKVASEFETITTDKPEKGLLRKLSKSGGRNHSGKMTMRYRGGGHKRRYREIDFKRDNHGVEGVVNSIEYDPNRTARIALIHYVNGDKRYIVAPMGLEVGHKVQSGEGVAPEVGNALFIKDIHEQLIALPGVSGASLLGDGQVVLILDVGDLFTLSAKQQSVDKIDEAIDVEKNIGMTLTSSYAMLPTASVSGWYFAHPESRYFGVAKINQQQVENYASRKGISVSDAERLLSPNLD